MSGKYLKYIPKTLQEDFIDNRVIPFVGAGFSKNAIAPEGASILDWEGLGKKSGNIHSQLHLYECH